MKAHQLLLAPTVAAALALALTPGAAHADTTTAVSTNWCATPGSGGGENEYHVTVGASIKDKNGPNSVARINYVEIVAPNGEPAPLYQTMTIKVKVRGVDSVSRATRTGTFQVNTRTEIIPKPMRKPVAIPDSPHYFLEVRSATVGGVKLKCVLAP